MTSRSLRWVEAIVGWLGRSDHSGARRGRDRGDLVDDKSGAIMVAGVFIAALLAAGIFYIIATGNAIIYRERLQDAADAAAYTSAGVHARGMNLIVLINLIMAALLAVLIVFRLLMIVLALAIIGCAICIPFTIFCPLSGPCAVMEGKMIEIEGKLQKGTKSYETLLGKVLPVLSFSERVIAIATPFAGAYKGWQVGAHYKPLEQRAWVVSPSMLIDYPKDPDIKIGLPVQEMEYEKFCKKSATIAAKKAFAGLPEKMAYILTELAGGLAKQFSDYFCGGEGEKTAETMKKKIDDMIANGCNKQRGDCYLKDQQLKLMNASQEDYDKLIKCTGDPATDKPGCLSKYCELSPGSIPSYDEDRCVKEAKEEAKKKEGQMGGMEGGGVFGKGMKGNKTPKDIWEGASIGGFWFQVYGFAKGDAQWPRKTDRGLAIATKSGALPQVPAEFGDWRIAQAEFYYDKEGRWAKNKYECMWHMGWRARLRRFDLGGLNIAGAAMDKFGKFLFDQLWKKLGASSLFGKNSFIDQGFESAIKDGWKKFIFDSEAFEEKAGWANDKLEGWFVPSWEFVH